MPIKNKTKDNELKLDLSFASSNSSITFDSLEAVVAAVNNCTLCKLCETRTNVVVFDGNPQAKLMIIGEGPGQQEDLTGRPFVGRAGQLLDKILESAEINRQRDTYICNVVKCRPPGNRVPLDTEQKSCRQYLDAQIALVQPEIILLAGATAVKSVLQSNQPISKIRGQWFDFGPGIKLMPIFHPSYLLRNDSKVKGSPKWLMWQDIKEVKRVLDEVKGKRK